MFPLRTPSPTLIWKVPPSELLTHQCVSARDLTSWEFYSTSTCKSCASGGSCPDQQCASKCCAVSSTQQQPTCNCNDYGARMCNMCQNGNVNCLDKQCANKCCQYSYGYSAEGNSWKASQAHGSSYAEAQKSGMSAALIYTLVIGALLVVAAVVAITYRRVRHHDTILTYWP